MSCLLALVVLLALGSAVRDVWTIDPDASAYLGLGRSLAAGEGYTLDGAAHAKYPPGLPLILGALAHAAGPQAYRVFSLTLVAALALAVLVTHRLICRLGYPPWAAAALASGVALSQTLADLSVRYLRTEVPFLAVSLAALLLISDALGPRRGWGRTVLAAGFLAAALSLRLAGITLAVVPALHLLWPTDGARGRARAALLLATAALLLAAWSAWGAAVASAHPGAPDYGSEWSAAEPRDLTKIVREDMPALDGAGLLHRVGGNLDVLARACAVLLTNVDRAGARLPLGWAALALVALGLAVLARPGSRARQDAAAYVAATLALYLVWPFHQQQRFYAPLLPLLLLAAGQGLVALHALLQRLAARPMGRVLALAAAIALALLLSAQRSDTPVVLGRWSHAYAALLALTWLAVPALAMALRRGRLPALRPALSCCLPALFLGPWLYFRIVEWPAQVTAFEARRAEQPLGPPLDRIDVDPHLEQVAIWLAEHSAHDAVVMTDVPKMLTILSGRRCLPLRYRVDPPAVLPGDAELIFYTGEHADAAAALEASAGNYELALELPPVSDGTTTVVPRVYRRRNR